MEQAQSIQTQINEFSDLVDLAEMGRALGIKGPPARMSAEDKKAALALLELTREERRREQFEALREQIMNHKIRMSEPLLLNPQDLADLRKYRR